GVGPLQGDLHHDAVVLAADRDHVRVQRRLQLGQVLNEAADATFVLERVLAAFAALVDQGDLDPGIQERELAQAARQDLVVELDVGKDLARRLEAQRGAAPLRGFHLLERVQRLAQRILLLPVEAVAPDIQPQVLGQRGDHRNAHAVQAAGNLVAVVVELATGVQDGEDHLGRRAPLFLVGIDRDAAAVVGNGDRTILEDPHDDVVGVSGQGLVHRVVDDLEHHVVQAGAVMHVTDVHARALAHGLQAPQHGDLAGVVGTGGVRSLFAHAFAAIGSQAARQGRRPVWLWVTVDYIRPRLRAPETGFEGFRAVNWAVPRGARATLRPGPASCRPGARRHLPHSVRSAVAGSDGEPLSLE